VSVASARWDRWAQTNPHVARLPRYSSLVQAEAGDGGRDATAPDRLRAAPREKRLALLPALVEPLLARVTGLRGEQLAGQTLNIDSLMSVKLNTLFQTRLG